MSVGGRRFFHVLAEVGAHRAEVGAHATRKSSQSESVLPLTTGAASKAIRFAAKHWSDSPPLARTVAPDCEESGKLTHSRMAFTKRHFGSSQLCALRGAPMLLTIEIPNRLAQWTPPGDSLNDTHCLQMRCARPRQNGALENGSFSAPLLRPHGQFASAA
jgi:hypothetical protein